MVILLILFPRLLTYVFANSVVKMSVQFAYTQEKGFSKEGGVSTFIHTKTRNPLVEHVRKHFCMQGQLIEQKKAVFGVKGVSSLPRVLKVPSQVLLNYMHLVLMGEFLRKLNIWINNQSDQGFLSQSYEAIDHAMMNVKFPHDLNRELRPLSKVKR